jgi:MoxR-like ATPase
MTSQNFLASIETNGYRLTSQTRLAAKKVALRRGTTFIITGPPGTGKTAFSEAIAKAMGAPYLYYLNHAWTSDEDLFKGVDVAEAVAGRPDKVMSPGCLAQAAYASLKGPVVLCLDEQDKAPERVDALLLAFLESGYVPLGGDKSVKANMENLNVVITSNQVRELAEPLQRRAFRLHFDPLPEDIEVGILTKTTGIASPVASVIVRYTNAIRRRSMSTPSLSEMKKLVNDLKDLASEEDDINHLLKGWLVKHPEEWDVLVKTYKDPARSLYVLMSKLGKG